MSDEGGLEVARIEISQVFDAEGQAGVFVSYSPGLRLLDAIGMLAWAQAFVVEDIQSISEDEDDE